MKLQYYRCGDYLLPDLGLTEEEQQPVGKYGMMRLDYLKAHRPILYTGYLMDGTLMKHLHEIDRAAHERMETLMPILKKQNGVTEEMKMQDQMRWVGLMNNLHHQVEEMILDELIYN